MLYVTYTLNFVLMIALPILLGFFLATKLKVKWNLFFIGAVTFILSQVVHLPLLYGLTALFKQGILPSPPPAYTLIFNAVVLGLAAGVCESLARYLVLRFWIKSARTWRAALMFGAGHGGVEAIIVGMVAALYFINLVAMQNVDVSTLPIPADQQALAARQIAEYWSAPWYATVLGAVERVFALCLHLAATVLVMQVFIRRNILWLGAAILLHSLTDGLAVFAVGTVGIYWTEAIMGLMAIVSVALIFILRPRAPEPETEAAPREFITGAPPSPRAVANQSADTQDQAEQSKYL